MDNNNDLSGILTKLLEDPATLSSVMSIAGNLMNSLPKENTENQTVEQNGQSEPIVQTEGNSTAASTPNAPQIPDLSAISALAGTLGGTNKKNDPRCNLLNSLRPYMSHGRAEKIDMMIKALELAELADGFLNSKKLF